MSKETKYNRETPETQEIRKLENTSGAAEGSDSEREEEEGFPEQVPPGLRVGQDGALADKEGAGGGGKSTGKDMEEGNGRAGFRSCRPLSSTEANAMEGDGAVNVSRTRVAKGLIYGY